MGLRQKAEDIFSDIVKRYHGTVESKSAKQLLASVKSSWEVEEKRDKLLKEIGHITQEGALQRSYFDLGLLNVRLMDFREAKNAFLKVIDIKPISELAERAKFNIGWCYKFRGKLDKSITTFEELLEKYPETKLAIDANCQIANIFHSKGDHEAAIKKYKEVADKFEKNELAPVALLYRSMIYLYDEGDLDNARIAFDELKKRYPYFWAVRSNGEYSKELIMREKAAAKGWLDSILLKGAVGFANVILNTSRPEAIGKKTPFSRFWSEKEMNGIVTRMLEKVGLAKNVKDTRVDFKLDEVDLNGSANLGIIHISAYAKAGAEPSRGGLKFTVIKYRFTFGKSNIPVPVPRFIVNRVIRRMNSMLTRKEIMLSVSEVKLTENDLTINGFRY